jgi:hypothetical protein
MKKELYPQFDLVMYTTTTCVDCMNPDTRRILLKEKGYNPESLFTLTDDEIRIITIRILFWISADENILQMMDTTKKSVKAEKYFFEYLAKWVEL